MSHALKAISQRIGYVGVGMVLSAAFAVHGVHATRMADTAPLCSEGAVAVSTLHGKVAVNPRTGVSVMAQHLYFHKGGNPELTSKQVFAVVHIIMHNGGRKAASYNALDFRLHGKNDFIDYLSGDTDTLAGPGLSAGTLLPGDSIAGDVSFRIPAAQQGYTLHWVPDLSAPYIVVPINR